MFMTSNPWLVAAIILAVGFFLGYVLTATSRRSYQNMGEAMVASALQDEFKPPSYHLLNHVTLPSDGGTTQIDHVLVSRFGIFVIETKDYKGWIFANAAHAQWTQVVFRKYKFQNPIRQNFRHVLAVQKLLDFLPAQHVRPAVVFVGDAEFKTDVPAGVFDLAGLLNFVRQHSTEVMSLNRMQFCVGRLETARMAISGATDVQHIEDLERRYGIHE
jgi:hypothetical protein